MKTLQEWAEYYCEMGIYIYPSYLQFDWSKPEIWKTFKQTINDVRNYNWKISNDLAGLSGKQGIRVLRLNIDKEESLYRNYCINKIFAILNLERYPWVIDTQDAVEIIINSPSFINSFKYDSFKDFLLIYKGFFELPVLNNGVSFYFNGIPTIKPAVISEKSLISCFDILMQDSHFIKR